MSGKTGRAQVRERELYDQPSEESAADARPFKEDNKLRPEDRVGHDWYRFVLSFPPHLVREYLTRFGIDSRQRVLDPFCGTGTTLVECKKLGIPNAGIERNPMACFASRVKLAWSPNPDGLMEHAKAVARNVTSTLKKDGLEETPGPLFDKGARAKRAKLRALPTDLNGLLLANSISPLPLHKTLTLLEEIDSHGSHDFKDHERLALAKAIVSGISNLHFGPEVGVGPPKHDAPVIPLWLAGIRSIANDLKQLKDRQDIESVVYQSDARELEPLQAESIGAVITSPPYPNEKDYTRTTRLESVLLGFLKSKADVRALKKELVRSNTRSVYKSDTDDEHIAGHEEIQRIARDIERRRIELGKTSGFERQYHRVAKLYFGGMARHFAALRRVLRPGARLAYVVGDQASYLRVMIRTGQLLAGIAESLGYEVVGIDLFRTRLATATKDQLREEVVVLRWPGKRAAEE